MTARENTKILASISRLKKICHNKYLTKEKKTEKNIYDIHDTDLMVFFWNDDKLWFKYKEYIENFTIQLNQIKRNTWN